MGHEATLGGYGELGSGIGQGLRLEFDTTNVPEVTVPVVEAMIVEADDRFSEAPGKALASSKKSKQARVFFMNIR
jgi:hypothetical protein